MEIKINGFEFKIIEGDLSETTYLGKINYTSSVIKLEQTLNRKHKETTLIHELTHAFLYCYGFDHLQNANIIPTETLCEFIAIYGNAIIEISNKYFKVDKNKIV